jgi:hypothetical protein
LIGAITIQRASVVIAHPAAVWSVEPFCALYVGNIARRPREAITTVAKAIRVAVSVVAACRILVTENITRGTVYPARARNILFVCAGHIARRAEKAIQALTVALVRTPAIARARAILGTNTGAAWPICSTWTDGVPSLVARLAVPSLKALTIALIGTPAIARARIVLGTLTGAVIAEEAAWARHTVPSLVARRAEIALKALTVALIITVAIARACCVLVAIHAAVRPVKAARTRCGNVGARRAGR